jgi:hypothetical protein
VHRVQDFSADRRFRTLPCGCEGIEDVDYLVIRTLPDVEILQDSNTARPVFSIPALIEHIFAFTPLHAGEMIAPERPAVSVSRAVHRSALSRA